MTTLVAGATGATGRLVVEQLLHRGQNVKVIVRMANKLPEVLRDHDNLCVVEASILDLNEAEMGLLNASSESVREVLGVLDKLELVS